MEATTATPRMAKATMTSSSVKPPAEVRLRLSQLGPDPSGDLVDRDVVAATRGGEREVPAAGAAPRLEAHGEGGGWRRRDGEALGPEEARAGIVGARLHAGPPRLGID